jgi:hypothetical protein
MTLIVFFHLGKLPFNYRDDSFDNTFLYFHCHIFFMIHTLQMQPVCFVKYWMEFRISILLFVISYSLLKFKLKLLLTVLVFIRIASIFFASSRKLIPKTRKETKELEMEACVD